MLDILHLSGNTLVYILLILPVITVLSLAALYGVHEILQRFRGRRGAF